MGGHHSDRAPYKAETPRALTPTPLPRGEGLSPSLASSGSGGEGIGARENCRNSLRPGIYAITDASLMAERGLLNLVEQALKAGIGLLQYRDKSNDGGKRRHEAVALLALCRRYNVPLLINDDLQLAAEIGADGVHLGKDDPPLDQARQLLGPGRIIGVSCYNRLDLARQAAAGGADYLAFGRFFPSSSKPLAVQACPELLTQARAEFDLPLVAIGGITPQNGAALVTAGANMLAVIHGIFGQPDIAAAVAEYQTLFHSKEKPTP